MKRKSKPGALSATLDAWATHLGRERRTIARLLRRNEVEVTAGRIYTAREIFDGIHGSDQVEKVRLMKAQADLAERKNRVNNGELVSWSEVREKIQQHVTGPISVARRNCPPEHREWLEKFLAPYLYEEIGKVNKNGESKK